MLNLLKDFIIDSYKYIQANKDFYMFVIGVNIGAVIGFLVVLFDQIIFKIM